MSPWVHATEGTQLAVTLLLFIYVGYKIDQKFGWSPWGLIGCSALGLFVGMYNFLRRYLKN